jgi:signal transduction histidine kinase
MIFRFIIALLRRIILAQKQRRVRARMIASYKAQQQMNEFLSIASHEFKTPLTSIKGNIQLVGRRLRNNVEMLSLPRQELLNRLAEAQELLEHTDQQLTRLTRFINILLESTKISNNSIDLFLEQCELNQLLDEVVQNRKQLSTARTIRVERPGNKEIPILADISRIKQVITHYLSNAHKFSPVDQPIDVLLREQEEYAYVSVKDYGQGIPAHEHEHIWERFYRVPGIKVLNGSEVGLGLGLHICRTFIERHKGQVGVQSEPGKGSTFWFTLPLLSRN